MVGRVQGGLLASFRCKGIEHGQLVRNSTLRDYISSFKSKHTLLIADACFSGSIFNRALPLPKHHRQSKRCMTCTAARPWPADHFSEVPDKSVFIEYLVKRLRKTQKPYLTSEELFYSMKSAILNNSPTVPQFGEILNTGDEGGDFILYGKDKQSVRSRRRTSKGKGFTDIQANRLTDWQIKRFTG